MSKRKLAVAMAGAMVATAVVPAFAAKEEIVKATVTKGSKEADKLVSDLRNLIVDGPKFEVELVGDKLEPVPVNKEKEAVYSVVYTKSTVKDSEVLNCFGANNEFTPANGISEITNLVDLSILIDLLEKDEELSVYVVNKGKETVDGKLSPVKPDVKNAGAFIDVDASLAANVTVKTAVSGVKEYEIADLFDGSILTSEGLDFVDVVDDILNSVDGHSTDGYTLKKAGEVIVGKDNKTITLDANVDFKDADKLDQKITLTVKSKDAGHTAKFAEILNDKTSYTKTAKLAGSERYETAVEIAEASGLSKTSRKAVLVNSTSMIDGLTAAPYAKALEADVLLTRADSAPKATIDFLKRNDIEEVVIVGGKSVVSDEVVNQIAKVAKVKVTRVGGTDRQETSVLVANKVAELGEISGKKVEEAFVIASTGEADAMSIAPVAVRENAPIIVEGFSGLSSYAKEFLRGKEIEAIGGNVTSETIDTLKILDKSDIVPVVAGKDRFSTNAKIIKKHYALTTPTNVFVAKDGYTENNNEALVDALAVGTYASAQNAPVVLATKDLTTEQKEALNLISGKAITTVTQIGNGVKHTVLSTIDKLVELGK